MDAQTMSFQLNYAPVMDDISMQESAGQQGDSSKVRTRGGVTLV